jgi:hypothetical protein
MSGQRFYDGLEVLAFRKKFGSAHWELARIIGPSKETPQKWLVRYESDGKQLTRTVSQLRQLNNNNAPKNSLDGVHTRHTEQHNEFSMKRQQYDILQGHLVDLSWQVMCQVQKGEMEKEEARFKIRTLQRELKIAHDRASALKQKIEVISQTGSRDQVSMQLLIEINHEKKIEINTAEKRQRQKILELTARNGELKSDVGQLSETLQMHLSEEEHRMETMVAHLLEQRRQQFDCQKQQQEEQQHQLKEQWRLQHKQQHWIVQSQQALLDQQALVVRKQADQARGTANLQRQVQALQHQILKQQQQHRRERSSLGADCKDVEERLKAAENQLGKRESQVRQLKLERERMQGLLANWKKQEQARMRDAWGKADLKNRKKKCHLQKNRQIQRIDKSDQHYKQQDGGQNQEQGLASLPERHSSAESACASSPGTGRPSWHVHRRVCYLPTQGYVQTHSKAGHHHQQQPQPPNKDSSSINTTSSTNTSNISTSNTSASTTSSSGRVGTLLLNSSLNPTSTPTLPSARLQIKSLEDHLIELTSDVCACSPAVV